MKQQKCNKVNLDTIKIRRTDTEAMQHLLHSQYLLMRRLEEERPMGLTIFREKPNKVSDSFRIKWLLEMLNCFHNELEEIREQLPWKHWKGYPDYNLKETLPEIKYEFIDLLHFLLESFIILGMDGEEVLKLYHSKNQQNHDRQDKGYK